jgi:hypothetical protein
MGKMGKISELTWTPIAISSKSLFGLTRISRGNETQLSVCPIEGMAARFEWWRFKTEH